MKKIKVSMTIVVDDQVVDQAREAIENCDYCLSDDFGHLGVPFVSSHLNSLSPSIEVSELTDKFPKLPTEKELTLGVLEPMLKEGCLVEWISLLVSDQKILFVKKLRDKYPDLKLSLREAKDITDGIFEMYKDAQRKAYERHRDQMWYRIRSELTGKMLDVLTGNLRELEDKDKAKQIAGKSLTDFERNTW